MKKIIVCFSLLFLLTGCSSGNTVYENSMITSNGMIENSYDFDYSLKDDYSGYSDSSEKEILIEQKLVYSAEIDFETKNFDADLEKVNTLIADNNGYVQNNRLYGGNFRSADLSVRIPIDNYRKFINELSDVGNKYNFFEKIDDVTLQYTDYATRLNSLEKQMSRLEELRNEAGTLNDLLTIEERISTVQQQIEYNKGQLNYLTNKIKYSTIEISLSEVVNYEHHDSFFSRLIDSIKDSADSFVTVIGDMIIGLIYLLPYAVIVVIGVIIGIKTYHKKQRKHNVEKKTE